jgi:hypothetical protein
MFQPDPANIRTLCSKQAYVAYNPIFKIIFKVNVLMHSQLFDYSSLSDN